jgi:hypothetical protein
LWAIIKESREIIKPTIPGLIIILNKSSCLKYQYLT